MRRCAILQSTNPYACSSPCGPCPAGPTGPAGPPGEGTLFLLDTENRLTVVPRAPDTVVAAADPGTTVAAEFLSADNVPLYAVLAGTWEVTLITTATVVLSARFVASVVEANGTTVVVPLLGQSALFPVPVAPTTTTTTLTVALPPAGTFFNVSHRLRLQLEVVNPGDVPQNVTIDVQGATPSRVLTTAVTTSPGGAIPDGTAYSDYLYWNGSGAWEVGSTGVHIGAGAGLPPQGLQAVAVGPFAASDTQGDFGVAVGASAGYSGQGNNAVAMGSFAGFDTQGYSSVAIGSGAGFFKQEYQAVAIGASAGNVDQSFACVAVGYNAGLANQMEAATAVGAGAGASNQGTQAVALGNEAGYSNQRPNAVAAGYQAGFTLQGEGAVAVGFQAGNSGQGENAVAVGFQAGNSGQGANAVAIGYLTATVAQPLDSVCVGPNNTMQGVTGGVVIGNQVTLTTGAAATYGAVVLNGTNTALSVGLSVLQPAGFWVTPVRNVNNATGLIPMYYDPTTKEVVTVTLP
jgi:hypothetical protein